MTAPSCDVSLLVLDRLNTLEPSEREALRDHLDTCPRCRESADEVETLLAACAREGVAVVPWGGGTSVTGGVNTPPREGPVVCLDLERMSGLLRLDQRSGLATFGPGTTGPATEGALAAHSLTLGHFPQSWELSTVGGWTVTRSSGQESLGYGGIADLVARSRDRYPDLAIEVEVDTLEQLD